MNNLTEKQLTERLKWDEFCHEKGTPKFYKSLVSGKEYDYFDFLNHGKEGIYKMRMDLPENEYPYTIVYNIKIPKWKI